MIGIITRICIGTWREPAVPCQTGIETVAAIVGATASLAGTVVSMQGARAAGAEQQKAKEFQAAQQEQQAQESRAAAQRQALERQRQTDLAKSTLQARAAASGAGATDETVLNLGEDLSGRGEYQRLMDIYTGENRARGYEDAAMASRMTGQAERQAANTRATGTLLSGIGSFADSAGKLKTAYSKDFG